MKPPELDPAALIAVGTANVRDTLPEARAFATVNRVLEVAEQRLHIPVLILGLQEWKWGTPNLPKGYLFARPKGGGGPFVFDVRRLQLDSIDGVPLAPAGHVGHLAGRKSDLPESIATVAEWTFEDESSLTGTDFHLTAEVQKGKGYRTDPAHALRVARHKVERHALHHELTTQRGRRFAVGDSNFDGMLLPPLVSCWVGHDRAEAAGTLGDRTPDYVYAEDRAHEVTVIRDMSDHDAGVATYPATLKETP